MIICLMIADYANGFKNIYLLKHSGWIIKNYIYTYILMYVYIPSVKNILS